ncbi:ABC-type polar amino acid transport system ATPase subunit, partial [Micrococcus endophyticus]
MAQQTPQSAAPAVDAAGVHVADLNKSYGSNHVLRGIDLDVAPGEVVCLIGPSGSGKSTLLRCVNLLEKPDSGRITVGEFDVTDEDVDLDALRRHVGMVFQQFNLFPHLSVLENCTVAQVKVLKRSKAEAAEVARRQLARVGLAEL